MQFSVFYFHSLFIIKINSLLHFACWFVCLLDKRDSGPAFSDCRASFSALHQRAAKLQQDWRRSAVSSLQGPVEPLARLRNQGRFSSGLVFHQASASRCVCKNNQQEVKGQAAAFSFFSTASPHDYGSFAHAGAGLVHLLVNALWVAALWVEPRSGLPAGSHVASSNCGRDL